MEQWLLIDAEINLWVIAFLSANRSTLLKISIFLESYTWCELSMRPHRVGLRATTQILLPSVVSYIVSNISERNNMGPGSTVTIFHTLVLCL